MLIFLSIFNLCFFLIRKKHFFQMELCFCIKKKFKKEQHATLAGLN